MNLPLVHYTDTRLLQPADPITVNVIGAGGTGSHVTMALADLNCALHELGHPGLQVRLFDQMPVRKANLARQRFCPAEVGMAKATAIISRINRYYGYHWQAIPEHYTPTAEDRTRNMTANITFSCVDTVAARQMIAKTLTRTYCSFAYAPKYWIDCGNSLSHGQVWAATIGTIQQPATKKCRTVERLPFITDEHSDQLVDNPTLPSCSVREALMSQDLFINRLIALNAVEFLWKLLRNGQVTNRGVFYTSIDGRMIPIPLPEPEPISLKKGKKNTKPQRMAA